MEPVGDAHISVRFVTWQLCCQADMPQHGTLSSDFCAVTELTAAEKGWLQQLG